jgi:hypothetical protein
MRAVLLVLAAVIATSCAAQAVPPPPPDLATLAQKAHASADAKFDAGAGDVEAVYRWSVRWYQASKASDPNAAGAHAKRMRDLAGEVGNRFTTGMATAADVDAAAFFAAEADLWVKNPP